MKLQDKTFTLALVTGATSGIGESLCYLLAEKKIPLIITGRNATKLHELQKILSEKINVLAIVGDLSKSDDRKTLTKVIQEMVPDLVINNAGFGLYGNALDYPVEEQLDILEVNGKAYLELSLIAIKSLLQEKKHGTVLNVSSAAADYIFPAFSVYAASKAFVNSFSQSLDFEYKNMGIRILTSCPGYIKTQFRERAAGHKAQTANKIEGMEVSFAVEEIWKQIQTGKSLYVFNWKYRIAAFIAHFLPKRVIAPFLHREIIAKKNE